MKRLFGIFKNYQLKHLDFRLLLYVIVLTVLGILVIGSASDPADGNQRKQIIGLILGLIVMVGTTVVSYKFIFKFYFFFLPPPPLDLIFCIVFSPLHTSQYICGNLVD